MPPTDLTSGVTRLAIVGAGRLGTALVTALQRSGSPLDAGSRLDVIGPLGRGANADGCDAALLCVPDREIAAAAATITPELIVGHCSGATGLQPLAPHEAFSLHPLMTVSAAGAEFAGATAAIDASSDRALLLAKRIAAQLSMEVVHVDPTDRVAYHAAASIASNFLITLEAAAERLAATAGVRREALVPLVRATVESWATLGPERALTGPVARGDEATVALQREAVADRAPDLLRLFDALTAATRALGAVPLP